MILFLNEDQAYRYWVIHHRRGFVIDGHRKPHVRDLVLHRADCHDVKAVATKRHHWTTGRRLKACSLDRGELESWALEESGRPAEYCSACRPTEDRAADPVHLTRLGREVLDYILEAAVIHMEFEHPPYHVTIADIGTCFGKTPGQMSPVLQALVAQHMIVVAGSPTKASAAFPKRLVFPTITALRTLDAFRDETDAMLEQELAKLRVS